MAVVKAGGSPETGFLNLATAPSQVVQGKPFILIWWGEGWPASGGSCELTKLQFMTALKLELYHTSFECDSGQVLQLL